MSIPSDRNRQRPAVSIGLVLYAKEQDTDNWARWLKDELERCMGEDFPDFSWEISVLKRHDFPGQVPLDPLSLLEFGSDIKIEYGLDYVLVLTTMPMKSRFSQGVNGVPSNMLETGAITLSRILELDDQDKRRRALMSLVRHILGHLWGLDHNDDSVMQPRKFWTGHPPTD